jgi:HK97 family phage major capsid protein/HK97 family phage prohead protease
VTKHLGAQYDAKATRIVATTNDIDRDGEVVDPLGVTNLEAYLAKNPVILWQHDHRSAPVGKAVSASRGDDRIEMSIEWADTQLGREVRYLYDNGFMSSFSIGFIPRKSENRGGVHTWTQWELLEVSAVSVPANPMANVIRSAESAGYELVALKSYCDGVGGPETDESPKAAEPEVRQDKIIEEATMAEDMKENKIDDIRKQIEADVRAEFDRKAKDEAMTKALADAEARAKDAEEKYTKRIQAEKAGEFRPDSEIKVGAPAEYKGVNLKRAVETFRDAQSQKGRVEAVKRIDHDEARAMHLLKGFVDLHKQSYELTEKSMVGGTTTLGGFLVDDEMRAELLAYARLSSVALRNARVEPMASDVQKFARENAKVTLAFSNEATAITESSATFEEVTVTAVDLDGYANVSWHLEQDSKVPIAALLLDQFTEAFGQRIDSAVFAGTGSPMSGVFVVAAGPRSETFAAGSTNFSAVLASNLVNAIGKLEAPRRVGAKWYVRRDNLWTHINNLKDTTNVPYLARDFTNGVSSRMLGFPVEETEWGVDTGSSKTLAVFGNLDAVIIGERLNTLTLFRNPYLLTTAKKVLYAFWTRVGFAYALPANLVAIRTA